MPEELPITKAAGPDIFFQSQLDIAPSGSLELIPSSKTLSVGKLITWSGPAKAKGSLLVPKQLSHDCSFLQELHNTSTTNESDSRNNILFIILSYKNYLNPSSQATGYI